MDTHHADLARLAPRREPTHARSQRPRVERVLVVGAPPDASHRIRLALRAAGFEASFAEPGATSLRPPARRTPALRLVAPAVERSRDAPIRVGRLELDAAARRARLAGRDVALTATELDLLLHLARQRGRAVSQEELLRAVRDRECDSASRTVVMHVSTIRRKLGDDAARPRVIQTVRGFGYRMP